MNMLLLSILITLLGLNNNANIQNADAFVSTPVFHIPKRSSQIHKTIPNHKTNGIITNSNNNDNEEEYKIATSENEEKVINFLKRENQLLKHEIQLLQDTNRMLRDNAENIIIETFEGESTSKWFRDEEDEDEDDEYQLQKDDDETDEYWISNTTSTDPIDEITNEECIIPDNESIFNVEACPIEPDVSFQSALRDRAIWLVGLLLLQSFSGIILSHNEELIQQHPFIVYFLTMLVGAGGNAGNQASVRVIRGLALGTLNENTQNQFLSREIKMAFSLSGILSLAGFVRAFLFKTPFPETFAITTALCCIVLSSICLGAVLPLFLKKLGVDPAHSSTSIQVIMDVLGVFITVLVCSLILDSPLGQFAINKLSL